MACAWRQTYEWKMARDVSCTIAHGWTCLRRLLSCRPETKGFRVCYLFISSDAFPRFQGAWNLFLMGMKVGKANQRSELLNSCREVISSRSFSVNWTGKRMRRECVELCQPSTRGHRCCCHKRLINLPLVKWYVVTSRYCVRGSCVIIIMSLLNSILREYISNAQRFGYKCPEWCPIVVGVFFPPLNLHIFNFILIVILFFIYTLN